MTIMKKPYTKWILLTILVFGMIALVIILNYQNSKKTSFLNYPVNYSLCNNNSIDVKIYSNNNKLSFFDKDNITNIYIEDEENNYYGVKLENIIEDKKVLIEEDNYYSYIYRLRLPIKSDEIIKIDNALLKIVNKRGEKISFNIGNISMVNGEFFTLLETKSIIGMTKFVNDYSTLDKIKLTLHNFQLFKVLIKDIKIVSNVVETKIENLEILPDKTVELEIPLTYLENSFIDNIGILLTLEYQGSIYQQIINPYVLFKTSTIHTKPVIQIYEIS